METSFSLVDSSIFGDPDFHSAIQNIMEYKQFPKNHRIHKAGKICNHFYIIVSGIARVYYIKDKKDITVHFAAEQQSITAVDSLSQQKKSKYNIESIEEVDAFAISINELEKKFKTEPKFERFGRLFMQQLFVELVERVDDLQLHSAKERYQTLLSKKPHLFLHAIT